MKFYDTNALLNLQDRIFETEFAISSVSLLELENIKVSANKDNDVKYRARQICRHLLERKNEYKTVFTDSFIDNLLVEYCVEKNNDNQICACAKLLQIGGNDVEFVSDDILCSLIAEKIFGLNTSRCEVTDNGNIFKGYKIVNSTDEEISMVYEKDNSTNIYNCDINEYVIINDNGNNFCDVLRWNGEKYCNIWNKGFKSRQLGTIKPMDEYQRMAFDSIVNNDISVLYGRAGSGKTTIPLAYIMQNIESGKFRKCYIVHSFDTLKDQKTLGFVKGDTTTKMLETGSLGGILSTKLGDITEVERLIASGLIEIIPTAKLRGQEFASDTCCFCTESQNLDTYALKTLIQRCKTGCKIILEGDILEQSDTNRGVGLFKMINVFKGYKRFGCVKLKYNYRDEIGELADLL